MVGDNPRSIDDSNSILAHSECRGPTREVQGRPGADQGLWHRKSDQRKSECYGILVDLGRPLVDTGPLWSAPCTQSELISSWNHQLTSGFRLPSRIVSVLRLVTRNLRPDTASMWESFFFCSHDKTNGFPTQIREAGHVFPPRFGWFVASQIPNRPHKSRDLAILIVLDTLFVF